MSCAALLSFFHAIFPHICALKHTARIRPEVTQQLIPSSGLPGRCAEATNVGAPRGAFARSGARSVPCPAPPSFTRAPSAAAFAAHVGVAALLGSILSRCGR